MYWYTPKLECEYVAVTVLRNQRVFRDREVVTNRSDIIIACTTAIRPIRKRENVTQENKYSNKIQTKTTERKKEKIRCVYL